MKISHVVSSSTPKGMAADFLEKTRVALREEEARFIFVEPEK